MSESEINDKCCKTACHFKRNGLHGTKQNGIQHCLQLLCQSDLESTSKQARGHPPRILLTLIMIPITATRH